MSHLPGKLKFRSALHLLRHLLKFRFREEEVPWVSQQKGLEVLVEVIFPGIFWMLVFTFHWYFSLGFPGLFFGFFCSATTSVRHDETLRALVGRQRPTCTPVIGPLQAV